MKHSVLGMSVETELTESGLFHTGVKGASIRGGLRRHQGVGGNATKINGSGNTSLLEPVYKKTVFFLIHNTDIYLYIL